MEVVLLCFLMNSAQRLIAAHADIVFVRPQENSQSVSCPDRGLRGTSTPLNSPTGFCLSRKEGRKEGFLMCICLCADIGLPRREDAHLFT